MAQIMNSDKILNRIKVYNTDRLFYNKYPYKIVFKIDESQLIKSNIRPHYRSSNWANHLELRYDLIKRVKNKMPADADYRGRFEHMHYSVFVKDETLFEELLTKLQDCVTEVSIPSSVEHRQLMEENHRVRVRPTLFLGKYRFKVNIRNNWDNKFEDFEQLQIWLENLQHEDDVDRWQPNAPLDRLFREIKENSAKKNRYRYVYSKLSIYMNDDQDVMMLQLWLNKHYDSAEKAVLISEI